MLMETRQKKLPAADRTDNRYPPEDGIGPVSYTHLDVYKRQWRGGDFTGISHSGLQGLKD